MDLGVFQIKIPPAIPLPRSMVKSVTGLIQSWLRQAGPEYSFCGSGREIYLSGPCNRFTGMSVPALIPFKPKNPKTRLSCVLDLPEREKFAQMMLCDVVVAVLEAGCEPFILGTEPFSFNGVKVVHDPRGLNESINAYLMRTPGPLLIIMADIALPLTLPSGG